MAYRTLLVFALALAVASVLVVVPSEAVAHTSPKAEMIVELHGEASEGQAHCHGAIECVVTLFLQDARSRSRSSSPREYYFPSVGRSLSGVSIGHDPPIPIRIR